MSRVAFSLTSILLGGAIVVGVSSEPGAAVPENESRDVAELAPIPRHILEDSADLSMRFVQEDGADSGHVRVLLTPETRRLNAMEARSAAQQGFLEALNERGLGREITTITVVVRLVPGTAEGAAAPEQVFRYRFKGGRDWAVLPPE